MPRARYRVEPAGSVPLSPTAVAAVSNHQQDLSPTANKAVLLSFYRRPVWVEPQASLQPNPACLLAHRCTQPRTVHSRGHSLLTIERDAMPN